ncbi:helix-turn-helix domain-containing protein [Candidatus Enterococcus clewellii]|uniref:HTH cro/C1-type domain-containing protein n=1 Tax=Candidatus Enterococcus clewellii TaxID=1834193 RepID=A0A242KDL0_9ENTE|nr:helix-turn-helix domain-containing protein [Enterococcus sp. 9E7_DIV0242]OTP19147.1 hypothetical protein A5888_000961 [Enterococcus sp. 9E7_DIV0242]
MSVNLIEVGNRIKHIRKKHNYSMAAFAKLVGNSSASTVNNWEKGNNLPKADRLEKIALLGNTSSDWIKYGDFNAYIQTLLNNSATITQLSDKELDQLSRHLQKKDISYEDDVQILIEAKNEFPKLFAHRYEEAVQESTALIAEEEPLYLVEKENDYRDHLLPLIDELASKSTYFSLLTKTAHLLINEDVETISFLEGK